MGVPDTSVFCLAVAAALISAALAAPDHFDQRQTGQYNVRIQLKELKIIAVAMPDGGEEGDYDEGNYDYEDPVDPMEHHTKSTTAKSTTTTATTATAAATTTITTAGLISSVSANAESDSLTTESAIESLAISSIVDSLTTTLTKNTSEISSTNDTSATTSVSSLTTFSNDSSSINDVVPAVVAEEINSADLTDAESTTDSDTSTSMETPTTEAEEVTTKRVNNKYDPNKRIRSRVRCRPGFSKDRAGRCRKTRITVKPVAAIVSH